MKNYEKPTVLVTYLAVEDCIRTSDNFITDGFDDYSTFQ